MSENHYGISLHTLQKISSDLEAYHEEVITPDYWHGYFTALAASPVVLPEESWLNLVFNKQDIDEILKDNVVDMLTGITREIYNKSYYPYFPGNANNWKECNPSTWCDGFLTASYLWPEDIQAKAGEELIMLVLPILIFHDPQRYLNNHTHVFNDDDWEKFLTQNFAFLRQGLFELTNLWQEILEN